MTKTKFLFLGVIFMMLFVLPFSLNAQTEAIDEAECIGEDCIDGTELGIEVILENHFVADESVNLTGHYMKDVYAFGSTVNISGIVEGDVIAAGSYVRISGEVKGNVRAAGSTVDLDASVGKNASLVGGIVNVSTNSEVYWDLMVAGGMVQINGPIYGSLKAAAGELRLNSYVAENIVANIDKEGRFIMQSNAEVSGDVTYTWDKEVIMDEGAVVSGDVVKKDYKSGKKGAWSKKDTGKLLSKGYWGMKLFAFAALLLIGLIIIAIWGKFSEKVAERSMTKFGISIGVGFLVLILTPLAFIILMITIIGIPLALVSMTIYILLFYICKVFASLMVGNLILKGLFRQKKVDKYLGFLVGLFILSLIGLIPFLGGLIWFIVTLTAVGAFVLIAKELAEAKKKK